MNITPSRNRRPRPPFFPRMVAIGLLAVLALGCEGPPDAAELLAEAKQFLAAGDTQSGVISLKNALQADPSLTPARRALGEIYLHLGQYENAAKELRLARAQGDETDDTLVALGRAMFRNGQYEEMLEVLGDDMESLSPKARTLRGQALAALDRPDEAREAFMQAIDSSQDDMDAEAQLGLATLELRIRNRENAGQHLTEALTLDPGLVPALLLKGELELREGDLDGAGESYSKALERATPAEEVVAHQGLSRVALARRDTEAIKSHLEALSKLDPDGATTEFLRGASAYLAQDYENAEDALLRVLRVNPKHGPSLLLLGSIKFQQDRLEQAQDLLSRYLSAAPSDLAARKLLAAIHLRRNQPRDALDILERSRLQGAEDAQYLAILGSAYLRSGDANKAAELLEKAAAISPAATGIKTQLAISHLAKGDSADAVAELSSVIELDTDAVQADMLLVLTHLRKRDTKSAMKAAQAMSERHPDNPISENLLGAAYLAKGEVETARQHFEQAIAKSPGFVPATLNLARLDQAQGDSASAARRLEQGLSHAADHPRLLSSLAQVVAAEDPQRAESLLEQARDKNPDALEPRLILGQLFLSQRTSGEAAQVIAEARQLRPDNPAVLVLTARLQTAERDYPAAEKTYGEVLEQAPDSTETLIALAGVKRALGKIDEGRALYERVIEIDDHSSPRAMLELATLELAAGNTTASATLANALMERAPSSASVQQLSGDVAMSEGRLDDAIAGYRKAVDLGAGTSGVLRIKAAYERKGEPSTGLAALEDWVAKHPDDDAAQVALATSLQTSGDTDRAINEYKQILAKRPDQPVALNNLAWLYADQGNPEAITLAERAHAAAPENPAIADTLGWLRLQDGQVQQAVPLLRLAAEQLAGDPEVRYHYAAALARAGDKELARDELKAALDLEKPFSKRSQAEELLLYLE